MTTCDDCGGPAEDCKIPHCNMDCDACRASDDEETSYRSGGAHEDYMAAWRQKVELNR